MCKVNYFEIPAKDPQKIKDFYNKVFDWSTDSVDDKYWMINSNKPDEEGINGAIYLSEKMDTVLNTISVPDMDEFMKKIKDNGGEIIDQPHDLGKWGWHVYFKDPGGTILGVNGPMKR